jgi:hypothetical protein
MRAKYLIILMLILINNNVLCQKVLINNYEFNNLEFNVEDEKLEKLFNKFYGSKSFEEQASLFINNSLDERFKNDFNKWKTFIQTTRLTYLGSFNYTQGEDSFAIIKFMAEVNDMILIKYLRAIYKNGNVYTLPINKDPNLERTLFNISLIKPQYLKSLLNNKSISLEIEDRNNNSSDLPISYSSAMKVNISKAKNSLELYLSHNLIPVEKSQLIMNAFDNNDLTYLIELISSQFPHKSYKDVQKELSDKLGYNIMIPLQPENIEDEK